MSGGIQFKPLRLKKAAIGCPDIAFTVISRGNKKSPPFGELLNQSSALTYTSITISEICHILSGQSNT